VRRRWRDLFSALGPGLIAGAADDDPAGIATYTVVGARHGTALLWVAPLAWPLMAAVQMACARIGLVTGQGLIATLQARTPRPLMVLAVAGLFVANTVNVGADLAGMGDAAEVLTGIHRHLWIPAFAVGLTWATVRLRYTQIARTLKWLTLALVAYVATAFLVGPDWGDVLRATLIPAWPRGSELWTAVVALLGTTISPYLFVWQTAEELEEDLVHGKLTPEARIGATTEELSDRRIDVGAGTGVAVAIMYFIMLTAALTLHGAGLTSITTSREAALALRPLAGRMAALLYTIGLVGVGLLAIPTLTASAAYASAEVFGWREGLDERFRGAPAFYAVIGASTVGGVLLDFLGIAPLQALFWSAVVNGLLAPFLLLGILGAVGDARLMAGQPMGRTGRLLLLAAIVLMFGAMVGMMAPMFRS
jgi:Mn2+/Fe2+ NRAMP family transporter